jgi:hypothetical protein
MNQRLTQEEIEEKRKWNNIKNLILGLSSIALIFKSFDDSNKKNNEVLIAIELIYSLIAVCLIK